MLEIVLIWMFCSRLGKMLRAKGRAPGGYQVLGVVLWIGGEIAGGVIGAVAELGAGTYLLALMGAAVGATITWMMASSAKPLYDPGVADIFE